MKPAASIFNEAQFIKSPLSNPSGDCVEVARVGSHYGVRDSKNSGGPVLVFTPNEWNAFATSVKDGFFDNNL